MWTRKLLKDNAKIAFRRNYWLCVAVSLVASLLGASATGSGITYEYQADSSGYESDFDDYYDYEDLYEDELNYAANVLYSVFTSPIFISAVLIGVVVGIAFSILISNVVAVGHKRFYMENREHKTTVGKVFHSFSGGRYGNTVWIMFWKELYIFGWSLLFFIPGIIKAYSYMMIPYIVAENPDISKERAFAISKQMMDGHKWEAFVLELSFFGWKLLNTIPLVGILWTAPYMDATFTEFYTAVRAEAFQKGITNTIELPGVSHNDFTQQF